MLVDDLDPDRGRRQAGAGDHITPTRAVGPCPAVTVLESDA